ncbi:MAG: hypothetical protein MUO18_04370, partial [Methanomassiliicoccales archaeon]|nr:hypothetical protein [Methanomassiliicoccales archaeon]
KVKNPIEIVLANSGVSADTRLLDVLVDQLKEKDRPLFDRRMKVITDQSLKMKRHLENGELDQVGKLMVENHQILIEIGLSHEKLIYLCNLALRLGALGAKLTGGGMGGYMVALTPGKALQEKVAKALEDEGFFVIRAMIGDDM